MNDSASGKNGGGDLTPEQAADVQAAQAAAQGLETPSATSEAQGGDQGGGGAAGGPTAPPVPPPTFTISGGTLVTNIIDGILARYFGKAGPLPPQEFCQAVALWDAVFEQFGGYLKHIGPGGQLALLYGVHVVTLYSIQLMTQEQPPRTEPENTSSPDSPAVERPRS